MVSTRLSVGLCIVFIVGLTAAVPAAVTAQEDRITLTVSVVDQDGDSLRGIAVAATWDDGAGGPVNATTASNGRAFVDVPSGANVSIRIDDDEYVRNQPVTVNDASEQDVTVSVSQSATAAVSVVDTDGEPVEGAQVRLIRDGRFVTDQRTAADGIVTTPRVEAGDYEVRVTRAGYFRNQTSATITGETTVNTTIEAGTALVTFEVTDDHFEPPRPLENATVRIPSVGTVQTGIDNTATIGVPVNDNYDVVVRKPGYQPTTQTVSVGAEATTLTVSTQRVRDINVTARNQRVVVGETVQLEATDEYGDPVPNATVRYDGAQVGTTDGSGTAVVEVPAADEVTFTVDDGQVSATVTVEGFDPDATPEPTDTRTATAEDGVTFGAGPGFTPVTALVAVAMVALVALWRR